MTALGGQHMHQALSSLIGSCTDPVSPPREEDMLQQVAAACFQIYLASGRNRVY